MTEEYIARLLELTKEVKEYRDTTYPNDRIFLSKLDHLIGYILALEEIDYPKNQVVY